MAKKYKFRKTFTFDGLRYEVRADTEPELYIKYANKLRDLQEGKVTVSGNMTVKDWTNICLDVYKPNVSDDVKKAMRYRIERHILDSIGNLQLKNVTPLQCQKIMSAQTNMSTSHATKLMQEMKFIFEKAVQNQLILKSPAANVEMPSTQKGERRSITEYEREHLLKVAEDYKPFTLFLMILYCGCRPSEAIGAIGSDITVMDDVPMLHIRGTKTNNSDRFVPIPLRFYPRIKETAPDKPISPNNAGKHHDESSYNRLTNRLRREMNISMGCEVYRNRLMPPLPLAEDFVPYNLRHTYCTDLARKGVDVRIAQKLMGHASIDITANIYTHVDNSDLISAAKLINNCAI